MAAKTSGKSTAKRTTKRPPAPVAETVTDSVTPMTTTTAPSHDEIARRAFELFVARGRQHGRAHEDWANAERELRARNAVN